MPIVDDHQLLHYRGPIAIQAQVDRLRVESARFPVPPNGIALVFAIQRVDGAKIQSFLEMLTRTIITALAVVKHCMRVSWVAYDHVVEERGFFISFRMARLKNQYIIRRQKNVQRTPSASRFRAGRLRSDFRSSSLRMLPQRPDILPFAILGTSRKYSGDDSMLHRNH